MASGRGPTDRDVDRVSDTIEAIKEQNEDVEVCACLGLLSDGQAERLREAGADAYNHNLNTSEATYGDITHHPHLRRPGGHGAAGARGAGCPPAPG